MSGRRSLTRPEERQLLRVVRSLPTRDAAIICAEWFLAFRISEVLRLTVGHVWRNEKIVDQIGLAPRLLKGKRGSTRWVPVLPELRRALTRHLWWLRLKYNLTPDMPLFPSRKSGPGGGLRAISRVQAHNIIKAAFASAGILDDGRLGTHSLRKTMAQNCHRHCRSPLVVKAILNHSQISSTLAYLEADAAEIHAAIASCDFTRRPRKVAAMETVKAVLPQVAAPVVTMGTAEQLSLFPSLDTKHSAPLPRTAVA